MVCSDFPFKDTAIPRVSGQQNTKHRLLSTTANPRTTLEKRLKILQEPRALQNTRRRFRRELTWDVLGEFRGDVPDRGGCSKVCSKTNCVLISASSKPMTEFFAQPRLSRVKRRPYSNKHTQICTPLLGTTAV